MLHAVAELPQDLVGDVERALADEVHPDALGPDEPHHLLDLVHQRLRGVVEEQVRLVEKEHQLGAIQVPHLGQILEELREQPEEEGAVEPGAVQQSVGGEHTHVALAAVVHPHQVAEIEGRLAEEALGALLLEHQQLALDGPDARRAHVPVLAAQTRRVVRDEPQHRPQVLQVEQQQPLVVGDPEGHVEHALLGVVELEEAGEEQRPHLRDGRADGVPLLAEEVPEDDRHPRRRVVGQAEGLDPLLDLGALATGLAEPRQVTLHVGEEHRDALARESLGQDLQGHGLARAGGAGHEPVTVRESWQQVDG